REVRRANRAAVRLRVSLARPALRARSRNRHGSNLRRDGRGSGRDAIRGARAGPSASDLRRPSVRDGAQRSRRQAPRGPHAACGALALMLAALGLYAVMAYAVTMRTREFGVRLALGASPGQMTALIAGDSLRLALVGVAIGGALGWPVARVLGALVFGVRIGD